jgi:PEP-CTERM motif
MVFNGAVLSSLGLGMAFLFVSASSGIAAASTIVFEEKVFDNSVWDQTVTLQGNGGSGSRMQVAGGNPGSSAQIDISLNMPGAAGSNISSAAWVFSIGSLHTYDPSAGAIVSIDYYEDAILYLGQGNGHATALALRQNGILYLSFARRLFTPETTWTSKSILNLVETDFRSLDSAANPDFSETGSLIEFGYVRGNSSPPGSSAAVRNTGIDNWRVELTTVPEPATAVLLGLGLASLAARSRHQRPVRRRL